MAIISLKTLFRGWISPYLTVSKLDLSGEVSTLNLELDTLKPFYQNIGDDISKQFVITHGLNTLDVTVEVTVNSSPYRVVITNVQKTSVNQITLIFNRVVASSSRRVKVSPI